jgi:hypothetical protein
MPDHSNDPAVLRKEKIVRAFIEKNGMPPMFGGLPTDLAKLATYLAGGEEPTDANQSKTGGKKLCDQWH